ncbi:hypothetical protein DWV84_05085 [Blautia sp. AF13-16]|nr:hypothetical protein C3R19_27360 [Blautia producta]RHP83259.1 hypothetical protein DXA40_03590 [Blautia sp. OF01-4LB]RHS19382.1 hypothetical protein DWV84_05085 [Blautia sp. AF13-16]
MIALFQSLRQKYMASKTIMQEKAIQITAKKVNGRRNSVQGRAKSSNRAKLIKNPQDKEKKMELCVCLKKCTKREPKHKKTNI